MAVVKVGKGGKTCGKAIDYAAKDLDRGGLASGINCPDHAKEAQKQFELTKEIHDQQEGRQYKHYIQSFKPGETTPEQAHEIGKQWAKENFGDKGYEAYVGTHIDKDHIHNHVIVNSVNYETGEKFQQSKADLRQLKENSDRLCRENGLSTIQKGQERELGEVRAYDMEKYQTIAQGRSYVAETALAVDRARQTSQDRAEFIGKMQEQGYKVDWSQDKKHIVYTHPEGKKVRAANLEKTFNDDRFGKEGMKNEFERVARERRNHVEPTRERHEHSLGINEAAKQRSLADGISRDQSRELPKTSKGLDRETISHDRQSRIDKGRSTELHSRLAGIDRRRKPQIGKVERSFEIRNRDKQRTLEQPNLGITKKPEKSISRGFEHSR